MFGSFIEGREKGEKKHQLEDPAEFYRKQLEVLKKDNTCLLEKRETMQSRLKSGLNSIQYFLPVSVRKYQNYFKIYFIVFFYFVLRCLRTGFESVMDSFGPACVMFEKNEEKKCDMEKNFSNQCLPNVQITV